MTLAEFIAKKRERADRAIFAVAGNYAQDLLNDLEDWAASEAEANTRNMARPYDLNNPRQFTVSVTFKEGFAFDYAIYVGTEGNTFKMLPEAGEKMARDLQTHGTIPLDTARLNYRH